MIAAGKFARMKNGSLVYVGVIKGTIAYVTFCDVPNWHKKVPVACLKEA